MTKLDALVLETAPRRSPLAFSVFKKSGLRHESLTQKVYGGVPGPAMVSLSTNLAKILE